jgi:hypothetical protein
MATTRRTSSGVKCSSELFVREELSKKEGLKNSRALFKTVVYNKFLYL